MEEPQERMLTTIEAGVSASVPPYKDLISGTDSVAIHTSTTSTDTAPVLMSIAPQQ